MEVIFDFCSKPEYLRTLSFLLNFLILIFYSFVLLFFQYIPPNHEVVLLVITYIGCALSLAGEVLTVFIYVVFM